MFQFSKLVVLIFIFIGLNSCTKKNQKIKAFCSQLSGSHIQVLGCHWKGRIRMDIGDARSGQLKPMVIWVLNSESGDVYLYNMGRKTTNPNPLATQRDQLKQSPKEMQVYLKQKKINDDAIVQTKTLPGRSEKNSSSDKNCDWYQLKEPENNLNASGRYDDVCISEQKPEVVKAYHDFLQSVRKVDETYFPISVEGLPLLSWKLPMHSPKGWIKDNYLPLVFVTGTTKKLSSTAMHRMEFKYFFKEMPLSELEFEPQWTKE